MKQTGTAKIFQHGRRQAVRLPKEFRLPGKEVSVRRFGKGLLLEPKPPDLKAIFARMDKIKAPPLERPPQPKTPIRKIFD
jgi:antitoxin VapB